MDIVINLSDTAIVALAGYAVILTVAVFVAACIFRK